MSTAPLCSVVVAAYNSAPTIASTIASVRLQTLNDWELLLVDDGSSDDTVQIVESIRDERIRVIRQANRGPSAARNAGLRSARGKFVSTLDSDDLWLPQYLERMTGLLEQLPDAAVAYGDAWALDDETGRIRKTSAMTYQLPPVPPPRSAPAFFEALLRANFVYNSVTMRREVVAATGGYDERLRGAEDWEFWLRIAASGRRFARVDERLAIYRLRRDSVTSNGELMLGGVFSIYRAIEEEWDVADDVKQRARSFATAYRRTAQRRSRGFPAGYPLAALRFVKRTIERRSLWFATPPREVASALDAIAATCGEATRAPSI